MSPILSRKAELSTRIIIAIIWSLSVFLTGCSTPRKPPPLPPSKSDLHLLDSVRICDYKSSFLESKNNIRSKRDVWGAGEKFLLLGRRGHSVTEESFFFDQEEKLVGFLMVIRQGLSLEPFPVLRDTLSQLKPSVEFFQNLQGLRDQRQPQTTALFMTGDEKSTTQYLVEGPIDSGRLLAASIAIDPYFQLLSPYRKEYLKLFIEKGQGGGASQPVKGPGTEDDEPFASRQQFARGETALLAYCGTKNYAIAAEAYQKAVDHGFSNKKLLAETHHKLGLALKGQDHLKEARQEMEKALNLTPDRPEVLNNLGHVYKELGDRKKAIAAFQKAIAVRPNYPVARFNLAEAYDGINRRRAITEYETYLTLAEGVHGEAEREAKAKQRLKELSP